MAPGLNLTQSNFHSKHISSSQSFQKAWTDLERAQGRSGPTPFFSDFLDFFFKVTVFRLSGVVQSLQECSCVVGMERSCTLAKIFFCRL